MTLTEAQWAELRKFAPDATRFHVCDPELVEQLCELGLVAWVPDKWVYARTKAGDELLRADQAALVKAGVR